MYRRPKEGFPSVGPFVSLETHLNPKSFPPALAERYGQYPSGEEGDAASKVRLAWMRDALAVCA